MKTIKLLITGGTIDKQYKEADGSLHFVESLIVDMLLRGRSTLTIQPEVLMLIDSGDMTEQQRKKIVLACKNSVEDCIVITHGTDAMVETAQYLAKEKIQKPIVLVGAMRPYSFGESDAMFNLGCAVTAVQLLPIGVYITMNGQIFPWDKVRKNFERGQFEWL